jgi:hypothetical protein
MRASRVVSQYFNSLFHFAAPEKQVTIGSVARPGAGRDEAFSRRGPELINVNEINT